MTSRVHPYPQVAPTTMRDAYLIATAFEDAAAALETDFPLSARMLRARAHRQVDAQRTHQSDVARQLDARGRWASRSSRCGPREQAGPAHVTVTTGMGRTTDLAHRTICERTLTGRSVTFGPLATGVDDDCPVTWTACRDCARILVGDVAEDPDAALFDELVDVPALARRNAGAAA